MLIRLAYASLLNRRYTALLTLLTIAISVALLLTVERMRIQTRNSFASTLSGTDLIVGARTGPVQLLLYSVFRIGDASNNIRYSSYQELAAGPQIAWTIPISLGDSHRGFRVLGTTLDYFEHYRYGRAQGLEFAAGTAFAEVHDAVLGAEVAERLGYQLGSELVLAHGTGHHDIMTHADQPFRVVGILKRTGTPVDRTVHVRLDGIEAIHADWQHGVRVPGSGAGHHDLTPQTLTAVLVGLKNRAAALSIQRQINQYTGEPLLAILPGLTLTQLWSLVGVAESALLIVAGCVVVAGMLGMVTALVTTLNERRREMAILRSVGARPWQIGALLLIESTVLTLVGGALGTLLVVAVLAVLGPWLASQFGLYISAYAFTAREGLLLLAVLCGGVLAGIIPALLAYTRSLSDGLTVRI
ncbi:MAG: ABC transporter permease [Lysobacterales bacterium]